MQLLYITGVSNSVEWIKKTAERQDSEEQEETICVFI